jgi:hypothetical protein
MKYLKKFNEEFISPYATDAEKESLAEKNRKYNELKEAKVKIYESMDPPMIEVFEDWSDYLLEIKDKYGEVTSPYGDVRDIIEIDGLDLDVDIDSESDYTVAHEHDYIWERGNPVSKDPRDIPTEKKLSMYGSDFDWEFLDYYKKHNGQVNPFYSFMVAFDSDYKDGRKGWSDEQIQEMTRELITSVKNVLKRLNAKVVKLEAYDENKANSNASVSWNTITSKNLDDVKYPRFKIGFII